jgi:stearoyl-CoA desaturase (delta-9 desaturase)
MTAFCAVARAPAAARPWGWTFAALARRTGPMVAVHLGALGALFVEAGPLAWALVVPLVLARGLLVTVGYHRYFAHRSFKTGRARQFLLGSLCCLNLQNGPLWWAAVHRHHHRRSDQPDDAHSPVHGGFLWGHIGWLFGTLNPPDWGSVRDLRRYPELVWLERLWLLPALLAVGACYWVGGWGCVCVCFCLTGVLVMHLTFAVNSLGHLVGWRRYDTPDRSRNSRLLAFLSLGDGWHNNHHHYPHAAQAGFFRWERDPSFDVIRLMEAVGLVWDVRRVPAHKLAPAPPANG